ncbi:MAG: DNA mismatch repair protein MutS [Bacteroidales bacterium]|nr:DNA mismatch repair protein MutS [Bacteroidales bacterium]
MSTVGQKNKGNETPLMKQYNKIKSKYPDALLLFRVGDFYETFGDDAKRTANILGIVLTKRANGSASYIDLAGFPHHALETYLPKLVRAGERVAICDQLEDPKLAKTVVKRGITELVTPGVATNDNVLENKSNNFLAAVHYENKISGISFLDISTGEFFLAEGSNDYIDKLLQSFKPSEVILQKNKRGDFTEKFGNHYFITTFDDWVFTYDFSHDLLLKHFETTSLKGFGVQAYEKGIIASGAALHYLSETHHEKVSHISRINRIEEDEYIWLDHFTIRNLELIYSPNENATTLLDVIDQTISPMGSRMLKRWIVLPLKDKTRIKERHDVVEYLMQHKEIKSVIKPSLKNTGDLERLISKVAIRKVNPRELQQIGKALKATEPLKKACLETQQPALTRIGEQLNPCSSISGLLEDSLKEDPPALLSKGNVIADGYNDELDQLRKLLGSDRNYLEEMKQKEIEKHDIPSLKIGFNSVFGYYLEVTNTHKNKVPAEWQRKQTLVNSERYITEELKEYEQKILGAEDRIGELENQIYNELVEQVSAYIKPIQHNATLMAELDCLLSFSEVAAENSYVRPGINDSFDLDIKNGRHPVIEKELPLEEEYVANDVYLDDKKQQIIILTGPNMSGKSALLRQTALIVLLGQMGSFVPADQAQIGIVDKIFTRVGASDNISSGESTFMVEMNETASILNNISNRSLILLDEIGRGTATYDGISIAWAIAEFLHEHPLFKPKTLFATHYHELNEMKRSLSRIKNYHIAVKEINNEIIFLRKLKEGGSEHSFGIQVARMAGMPKNALDRAAEILSKLEQNHSNDDWENSLPSTSQKDENMQLSFIQLDDPLLEQIKEDILNTNIDTLTPVEALMKLNEIKRLLKAK